MGVAVKGRTSARTLFRPLSSINAYILAGHVSPVIGHVRTHLNPAERPSRKRRLLSADSGAPPKAVPIHPARRRGGGE